ncbi:MAG: AAA family ATPase, partial [Rhabdochlamydiaceae bacterium]
DKLQANVQNYKKIVEPLKTEVEGLRSKSQRAQMYRGFASWIENLFMPVIEEIETHVLDSINDEFNKMFHRWFSVLVEDPNISVHIDDRFTPLVEQSGYELDAQSLSGGERTAVALAYRLALNFMVKRANESLRANLLILDEPTEGFSKEQIYRLRSVLEELECEQVILVSHERDLESLADRIYRVEKMDGKTSISVMN